MRLLLVVSRFPWPARKGDQLRATQILEALTRRHRVTLLAPRPVSPSSLSSSVAADSSVHPHVSIQGLPTPPPGLAAALAAGRLEVVTYQPAGLPGRVAGVLRAGLTGRPFQNGLFGSADLLRSFRRLAPAMDGVVIQLVRLAHLVGATGDGPPVVVDLIDSLDLNIGRRADRDRLLWRPFLRLEQRRLARAEARVLSRARRTVVVSPRDEAWLRRRHGGGTGEQQEGGTARAGLDRLVSVPLAMESAVSASPAEESGDDGNELTVALTGNLGYFPTFTGALWWLERVWPKVAARDSRLRLVIAGARPPRTLVHRVAAAPRATLLASPPDLKAVLAGATVAVAPLMAGSGVPVKVLEAWAMGVPVVASPWAAAGTGAVAGEDLLVAREPSEWVAAVRRLAADADLRRRLASAGRRRLDADHSPKTVQRSWLSVIDEAFPRP